MTVTYVEEQEMIADNDTLIITDPCYLINEEHWEHWLSLNQQDKLELNDYLRKYHNFGEVIAADTGFGDWCNDVLDTTTGDVIWHFTADAGMVMVCTLSDLTNYGYDKDELNRLQSGCCLTIIPNYSGHIRLCYEQNDTTKLAVIEAVGDTEEDINFNTLHLDEDI